ncbi:MAG: zinc-ribbon domain containing protein [bacterium]
MTKTCATCSKEFVIRPEDQVFYEQVNAPLPKLCPDCRMARRLAYRNERTLYKRVCDLCQKDSISLYPSGTAFPVYCHTCWWSDKWDPREYAMDLDETRPFLEQFRELQSRVPRIALLVIDSVRSDYTNNAADNKDCYLIFAAEQNEDSMYSRLIMRSKQVCDCAFVYDSELCYECIDCRQCFKCLYSEQCQSSTDLLFCFDLRDSQNCIFCTNGRHMNYSIFNQKCTKEEYEQKKAEILSSYESIEEAKREYAKLKAQSIVKYATSTKCHNATGDYMFNCHEGVRLFDASDTKNSSYMADSEQPIDCQDCNNVYYKPELCYDMMGILQTSKSKHSIYVMYSNECEYSDSCYNSTACFGCIRLNQAKYSILNKAYTKEEYDVLKQKIVASMIADGTYGTFFPGDMSPHGYNETLAMEYFPLTKDEALARGFRWQDLSTGTFGKETISLDVMPRTIAEVSDEILKGIFVCEDCGKNFRITSSELQFYRRLGLPIPHKDFECRHQTRMGKRNPRTLWSRTCMCDKATHTHEGACSNSFETAYAPERVEQVYCEACYQAEIA